MSDFRLGYVDPPWRFKNWRLGDLAKYGEKWAKRNRRSPYPVMTTADLCKMPVGDLFAKHSALLLWATSPKMEDAFQVMHAWGFKFINVLFTWVVRERIEALYGDVARIEIFARQVLRDWETWGNECPRSPYASILDDYLIPPIEAIVDEDEFNGLPVADTQQMSYSHGEQMPLLAQAIC